MSRALFLLGSSKQLWESARFLADFHSCGSFHRPFFFLVLFLFVTSSLRGRPAGSGYESATLLCQRLEETFEHDRHGKLDICSDDVLRGLHYKDYGHFLPVTSATEGAKEKSIDVESECRTRRIYRIGLGGSKARAHLAGGGERSPRKLHVGPNAGGAADLDSTVACPLQG